MCSEAGQVSDVLLEKYKICIEHGLIFHNNRGLYLKLETGYCDRFFMIFLFCTFQFISQNYLAI